MSKSQTATLTLLVTLILAGMPLSKAQPATSEANQPAPIKQPTEKNKFCKGWKSSITKATGETLDDGIIEVSDAGVSNSGEVIIHHSRYLGLHRGYTLSFPERIEFQIPLGDGRVAHYNGVLISSRQIQGHFFVTEAGERMQSHHGPTRHAYEDNWTAEGRPP